MRDLPRLSADPGSGCAKKVHHAGRATYFYVFSNHLRLAPDIVWYSSGNVLEPERSATTSGKFGLEIQLWDLRA